MYALYVNSPSSHVQDPKNKKQKKTPPCLMPFLLDAMQMVKLTEQSKQNPARINKRKRKKVML